MTIHFENESDKEFSFSYENLIQNVVNEALNSESCPYEAQVNVILTTDEEIRRINNEYRNIDGATDVLSFPMINYEKPADFSGLEANAEEYFDFESGELLLGDIVISAEKVIEQAEKYGHSQKRELAFLIAHSMLHLFGYDHMEEEEAKIMEEKQRALLDHLKIYR